jgi:hypothetical protein
MLNFYPQFLCRVLAAILICGKGGQSHIFGGSKGVAVTIESYGKLEISYINVDNFIHEQIGQFIQQINLDIILSFCH